MELKDIIDLLKVISGNVCEHNYIHYIDALEELMRKDDQLRLSDEMRLMRNLFKWDINIQNINNEVRFIFRVQFFNC